MLWVHSYCHTRSYFTKKRKKGVINREEHAVSKKHKGASYETKLAIHEKNTSNTIMNSTFKKKTKGVPLGGNTIQYNEREPDHRKVSTKGYVQN